MSKAYSSNLTSEQFELLEALIPPAKAGGRPREVDLREILNAIFYLLTQGCSWRNLPGDLPPWSTVYTYFRNWRIEGVWLSIHDCLRGWVRADNNCRESPSEAIIDRKPAGLQSADSWRFARR
ncbi:MAG: transposase [Acaryochloris sp. SU_5_25]|nr:transposase [Acaryochloris sp. SU_5_25]